MNEYGNDRAASPGRCMERVVVCEAEVEPEPNNAGGLFPAPLFVKWNPYEFCRYNF
jgi:hypothetical protein